MKALAIIGFIGWAAMVALLLELHRPTQLPHRAEWELYRQANSPDSRHCDTGTTPYYLDGDDGKPVFLECIRGQVN